LESKTSAASPQPPSRTIGLFSCDNAHFPKERKPAPLERRGSFRLPAMSGRQPDWDQLERMREVLVRDLSDRGVTKVEFVTAVVEPFQSSVWLCVSSDAERDELSAQPNLLELVHTVLRSNQLDGSLIDYATAQSQQTVNRDYEGSWFYALR
jgi:hypothetical protein